VPEKFSWTPAIVLIVLAIIVGGAGGSYLYFHNRVTPGAAPRIVTQGDNVTVNYIGIFGSGPDAGRVFDTSLYSVGSSDATYPKALEYHARGAPKNYTPLAVHVGPNVPSSGYSLGGQSFIQVVPGFWKGLLGLTGNQTHAVVVPPSLGYGQKNPACITSKPLTFQMPVFQALPGTTFQKLYPGLVATTGTQFTEPHYGWNVLILSANASFVTLENEPYIGESASPAGWPVVVTALSSTANGSGTITLTNQLGPGEAGHILGKDFLGNGPCSSNARGQFIVTSVDPVTGTYTEDFNQEVTGQTLIFEVTVVGIYGPVSGPNAV
jgi:FKBP-type peptidyl-prolyl cis-trans isomerase 2